MTNVLIILLTWITFGEGKQESWYRLIVIIKLKMVTHSIYFFELE